jgi:hypothetical protein
MEASYIKIQGYGGGPGCSFGNTYKGKFKLKLLLQEQLWEVTALEDGLMDYRCVDEKAIVMNPGNTYPNYKYRVEKDGVFYIGRGCIEEMK